MNEELKFLMKIQKKKLWVGGGGSGWEGQGGCERRIEVFVKIKKKLGGGGDGVSGSGWGGVRMDVIEELIFFWKIHKKKSGRGFGLGGGGGQGGCE